MIRKSGLIIFSTLAVLIIGFWFLLLDPTVKCLIEGKGSELNEAKINVGSVDFRLVPAGLTITNLEVTDKENPMKNLFTVSELAIDLNTKALFDKKVIIENMSVIGVTLNTDRKKSGAIKKYRKKNNDKKDKAHKKAEDDILSTPEFTLPNAKDVLSSNELKSVRLAKELQKDIDDLNVKWTEKLKTLPNESTFKKHKEDYKKLKSESKGGFGSILKGLAGGGKLAKQIKKDIKKIERAKKDFDKDLAIIKRKKIAIDAAKKEDIKTIQEKYATPGGLASNLTNAIFGPKIEGYVSKGLSLYDRFAPKDLTGGGNDDEKAPSKKSIISSQNIKFPEKNPTPDFLLKKSKVSVNIGDSILEGSLKDITESPKLWAHPAVIEFSGRQFSTIDKIAVDATLDHREAVGKDFAEFVIKGVTLKDASLSDSENLKLSLNRAVMAIKGEVTLRDGIIDGAIFTSLSNAEFSKIESGPNGETELTKALDNALKSTSALNFDVKITGDITSPKISIKSSIEKVIKQALKSVVKGKTDQFKNDLSSELSAQLKGPKEKIDSSLQNLTNNTDTPLRERLNLGKKIL